VGKGRPGGEIQARIPIIRVSKSRENRNRTVKNQENVPKNLIRRLQGKIKEFFKTLLRN